MKHLQGQKKGIAIMITLFVMIILVIFSAAVVDLALNQQRQTRAYLYETAALKTAEAGINYCMAKLATSSHWSGCDPAKPLTCTASADGSIEVYEHNINGVSGCIEGKVFCESYTGYFDIYFLLQPTEASMIFFKTDGPAGPMPGPAFVQSCNNLGSSSIATLFTLDGNEFPGRVVPKNAVIIVCRGRVGEYEKIIESCIQSSGFNNSNAVIAGRGEISITITGNNPCDKLLLGMSQDGETNKSLVRSSKTMTINQTSGRNDYLQVHESSGGRSDYDPVFTSEPIAQTTPTLSSDRTTFTKESNQKDYIPPLKMSDVKPDTSGFATLKAGSYYVFPRTGTSSDPETSPPSPHVYYYETDNIADIGTRTARQSKSYSDETASFRNRIQSGEMIWDPVKSKLTLVKSCKVQSATSAKGTFNSFNMVTRDNECIALQLGEDPVPDEPQDPAYLVDDNANGSFNIRGQVVGQGSIIVTGDVTIKAESQLDTNTNHGVAIYSGGSTTVQGYSEDERPALLGNSPQEVAINTKRSLLGKVEELYFMYKYPDGHACLNKNYFTPAEQTMLEDMGFQWHQVTAGGALLLGVIANGDVLFWNGKTSLPLYPLDATTETQSYENKMHLEPVADLEAGKYNSNNRPVDSRDTKFHGMVYTCKNFTIGTPGHSLLIQGALFAFGGDMESNPGTTDGNIIIEANDCGFIYDADYLSMLANLGSNGLETIYWAIRK